MYNVHHIHILKRKYFQMFGSTQVHSLILVVPTSWKPNKFEIPSELIVQIDQQYNVYDTFLNLIWYN